ncbi:MAG: hypothetical protein H0T08_02225 [Acidobacteria bacterium]|jgi:hypothetical protein|nr:hypothetical protein [Acidobacteriota bacterium]
MKRTFHENGLSIVLFVLFFLSLVGQYFTGYSEYNEERRAHGENAVSYTQYFGEGHFIEAVFENWESEFLQMGAYVLLTVFLFQKGSSESKTPGTTERIDIIVEDSKKDKNMPYPVRRGGLILKLYEYSLSIALFLLFLMSFVLHAVGGAKDYNIQQIQHNEPTVSTLEYMSGSRFWFESFQNWQSEFLSIGLMVVLSIYLRQKGSPESKPVDSPHSDTGTS